MRKFIFKGKDILSVGFFGLGRSNVGVMNYLSLRYPHLKFTLRQDSPIYAGGGYLTSDFNRVFIGASALSEPCEDLVFISPTVKRERLLPLFGDRITSDAEFFFEEASYPVFSITGSDGKSTTTSLSSLLLSFTGVRAPAIGNIGVAMTPMLDAGCDYAVAELSSFQLMNLRPTSLRALITNISPNHLDFHESYDEYICAKARIWEMARQCCVNLDDEISLGLVPRDKVYSAVSCELSFDEARRLVDAEVYITLSGSRIQRNGADVFDTDQMRCKTAHTVKNFAAAIALTDGYTSLERIYRVGTEFSGLSHRCELVGEFLGIKYYNSSIDSTPKRTATTLASFDGKPIVILGGKGKGLPYDELLPAIEEHASAVVITGANGNDIFDALSPIGKTVPLHRAQTFVEAVTCAIGLAKPGDSVLLSPASTSFDAFRDFSERGNKFKEIIKNYYYKGTVI